jgi:hypothetical protein
MMLSRAARLVAFIAVISGLPAAAWSQDAPHADGAAPAAPAQTPTADAYVAITPKERVWWIVDGTVGPKSLFIIGPLAAAWNTAFNTPEEWGRGWSGFGKRYAQREADVAIVVLGERHMGAPRPTDGEGSDVASLDLTGRQQELLEAVVAAGKPTVLVLSNGRPLSIRWAAEHVPAIVEAWNSGERGGEAVADVLFGDVNPSGKLPITVPRHSGQLPIFYNYMPSKTRHRYVDMPITPLWEFGYGLSYTTFAYSGLKLPQNPIKAGDLLTVEVTVTNTGRREGDEVVQLYLSFPQIPGAPLRALRGFKRIHLQPGESQNVLFELRSRDLSMVTEQGQIIVAEGSYTVSIGGGQPEIGSGSTQGHFRICCSHDDTFVANERSRPGT